MSVRSMRRTRRLSGNGYSRKPNDAGAACQAATVNSSTVKGSRSLLAACRINVRARMERIVQSELNGQKRLAGQARFGDRLGLAKGL